jgi:hypothetical protein
VSALAVSGAFALVEQMKTQRREERKHSIVKDAMMQPLYVPQKIYPELIVKDQVDMMRGLIFSNEVSLVLIEGAQGGFSMLVSMAFLF